MNCQYCEAEIQGRPEKRFCNDRCRVRYWDAQYPRKGKKPKRIRSRERYRLYTIIHKGETLEQLRIQAREAARIQALRAEEM